MVTGNDSAAMAIPGAAKEMRRSRNHAFKEITLSVKGIDWFVSILGNRRGERKVDQGFGPAEGRIRPRGECVSREPATLNDAAASFNVAKANSGLKCFLRVRRPVAGERGRLGCCSARPRAEPFAGRTNNLRWQPALECQRRWARSRGQISSVTERGQSLLTSPAMFRTGWQRSEK